MDEYTTVQIPSGCEIVVKCDCKACKKRFCAAARNLLAKIEAATQPNGTVAIVAIEAELKALHAVYEVCCNPIQPQAAE